jgi:hypothetical protein
LRDLLGNPGLLQRMIALGGKSFDGGDLLAERVADRSLAGSNGLAVDVDRAGAAETCAATEFGTGHLQLLANDPEQRRIVGRLDGHIPSVDVQIRHLAFPLPVHEAAYAALTFGYWLAPTESMPVGPQNDTDPIKRQCSLKFLEKNIILKTRLCVAAIVLLPLVEGSKRTPSQLRLTVALKSTMDWERECRD